MTSFRPGWQTKPTEAYLCPNSRALEHMTNISSQDFLENSLPSIRSVELRIESDDLGGIKKIQIMKPIIDPKTAKKIVFLNSKSKSSVELLESLFDLENLDASFGGRSTWTYEHANYSTMMTEDDLKTAQKWGLPLPLSPSPAGIETAIDVAI